MELKLSSSVGPLVMNACSRLKGAPWNSTDKEVAAGAANAGAAGGGALCEGSRVLLAELLLDIISSVSAALLATIRSAGSPLAKRKLLSSLEEVLLQTLAETLEVPQTLIQPCLRGLAQLIQSEVKLNVDAYFCDASLATPCSMGVADLGTALHLLAKVLKKFGGRIKKQHPIRAEKDEEEEKVEVMEEEEEEVVEMLASCGGCRSCLSTGPGSEVDTTIKSAALQMLQEDVRTVLSDLLLPLLRELPGGARRPLQAEATLEVRRLCDGLVALLELKKKKKKKKRPVKKVRRRIQRCLGEQLARVLLHRLVEQLRKRHPQGAEGQARGGAPQLNSSNSSLVEMPIQVSGHGDDLLLVFNQVPSSQRRIFTEELSGMIYCHLLAVPCDYILGRKSWRDLCVPEFHANVYTDIRSRVWTFVELTGWWLRSEVCRISRRVKIPKLDLLPPLIPLKEEEATGPEEPEEPEEAEKDTAETEDTAEMDDVDKEDGEKDLEENQAEEEKEAEEGNESAEEKEEERKDIEEKEEEKAAAEKKLAAEKSHAEQMERNKMCVKFFIEKIIQHVYLDLNVVPENMTPVVLRIFDKLWPRVQAQDFHITPKSFKNLNKIIHKVLCGTSATPEMVLFSLLRSEAHIDSIILDILHRQVIRPPTQDSSAVHRFFKSFLSRFRLRKKTARVAAAASDAEEKLQKPKALPPTEGDRKISSCLIPPQQWMIEVGTKKVSSPELIRSPGDQVTR